MSQSPHLKPPKNAPDAHPSPSVGLPPTAEEYGDRGTYKGTWWQGGIPWGRGVVIVIAFLVVLWLLRGVVGPMLSPATP
ncbi:MAG: hypothetical protein NCW75_04890 [Phycisphaera sp.]|nr:MAG: hypothetical protein NCW75_04890 [Phycisphaera sp.]